MPPARKWTVEHKALFWFPAKYDSAWILTKILLSCSRELVGSWMNLDGFYLAVASLAGFDGFRRGLTLQVSVGEL